LSTATGRLLTAENSKQEIKEKREKKEEKDKKQKKTKKSVSLEYKKSYL